MEYRTFDANQKPVPMVRVFLDGTEVTDCAFYAHVPADPGVEGEGTVGMYTQWPPLLNDGKTDLQTEYKTGQVYWVHKVV